jgi:hypothetical protein
MSSSFISRTKGSSHPTPPGGIYVGIIKTVARDGRVYVTIPKLGNTIGPMRVLNLNLSDKPKIGTQVLCAYTNMSNEEMYVIGSVTPVTEENDSFNIDGGMPDSIYGGIEEIDAGGVS